MGANATVNGKVLIERVRLISRVCVWSAEAFIGGRPTTHKVRTT